jgi:hypothetical protein
MEQNRENPAAQSLGSKAELSHDRQTTDKSKTTRKVAAQSSASKIPRNTGSGLTNQPKRKSRESVRRKVMGLEKLAEFKHIAKRRKRY